MSGPVYLSVDRDKLTGGLQLSINDDNGGYRLAGPKYCGMSKTLQKCILNERDIDEITAYLKTARRYLKKMKTEVQEAV